MRINRIIAIFLIAIPINFWGIGLLPEEKKGPTSPPNPSELSITWWDYYNVDSKELKKRTEATQEYFQELKTTLAPSQAQEAEPYFDRILKGLALLAEVKEEKAPPVPPLEPIKKGTLSFKEWIALGERMLKQQEELDFLKLKVNLAQSSYRSSSKNLDTRFAAYLKLKGQDDAKVISGLSIIQGKILVDIEKVQLSLLQSFVDKKTAQMSTFSKQALEAYRHIDHKNAPLEEIRKELQLAKQKEEKLNNTLILSYENVPINEFSTSERTQAKGLSEQKLLNAKIDYEMSRIEVVNLEIQEIIAEWFSKEKGPSRKELREKLEDWRNIVGEIQNEIARAETNSELILQQSLKDLALENTQNYFQSTQSVKLSEEAILKIEQLKNALYINSFLLSQLNDVKKEIHFNPLDRMLIFWEGIISFFKANGNWFKQSLFKIGDLPITPLGLIKFVIILVIAYVLGKFSRNFISHFGRRQNRIKITSIFILSRVSYYFFIFLGIIFAGYSIGLNLTVFAYIAGALAIWLGLSLQSIFHNFISGIIVLLSKSIRINDILELESGEIGTITDLNLRTAILRSFDGKDIIIPNADMVTKKFINHTLSSHTLRLRIPFRIPMDADKKKVAEIAIAAAKKVEIISDVTEPELWITGYGDNFINVELVAWINTLIRGPTASRDSQFYWALDDALREHGISIPIPLKDIHILKDKEPPPMQQDTFS